MVFRPRAFLVVLAAVSIAGCKCGGPPLRGVDPCRDIAGNQPDHLNACTDSSDCADHFNCSAVKGQTNLSCCVTADRKCNTEADCCPGQTCPADRKKCFDKYLSCGTDADCGDRGDRFCETWTDSYGVSSRCRFKPCDAAGACAAGLSCFQGECLADLPCGGVCDPGKACVPAIDRCQDYTSPTGRAEAACPVSCQTGFIATFQDTRDIWDTCHLPLVKCVCAELPPLQSDDLGRFSSLAADAAKTELLASAYDGQYGDLVVYHFDADGKRIRLDYVDGVPSGTVKYGPSGARGGIVDPGDDVGRYTDIAVNGAYAYVSYYDATHGDLKLAMRGADGQWHTLTLDGASADLGLYTSIAIDSDGKPGIAYFQRGGATDFDVSQCPAPAPTGNKAFITALKFAHASTPNPSTGDFTLTTLACQSRAAPACYGCTQTCADPGAGPGCYAPDTTCTGCDPNTETCIAGASPDGGTGVCAKKYNPSTVAEIPNGVGLFASLAFNGKDAYLAFMKRNSTVPVGGTVPVADGDLYAVKVAADGTVGPLTLLDGSGDTGYFPEVKVAPTGSIAVAYHDATSKKLKFWGGTALDAAVTPEVIDTGSGAAGSGESNWVGTDTGLLFTGSTGDGIAVYQDATRGDLKLAQRKPTWKVLTSIRTDGAVGFFADVATLGGKVFASHARIHAKLVAGEPRVDNSLILDPVTVP